jgi:hypothetical protein
MTAANESAKNTKITVDLPFGQQIEIPYNYAYLKILGMSKFNDFVTIVFVASLGDQMFIEY